ncbi:hypothetical protein EHQ27_09720 [Leptospira wolffii]|nr:hypothetical protein EHQ32_14810 [Leptospira wolffii]TGK71568.1 hypothetical protein EHQ27_09720 [Leptospira wolffii]TGK75575.1 hypothetical protein EHQ35_04185 [Leptospira wolffii]TGL32935.1 hypothetical protein EHQ57_00345 [Leptospira wolffii]
MNTVRSQVIPAKYFERFYLYLPYIIILWSIWFALQNQFLQDDAFISFRYAENLNKGYGLVFNPGERVEGYTNFLWTLLISFGMKIGFQPETFSIALGILLYTGTLITSLLIARRTWNDSFLISSFLFLLGSNYSFSSYATGGLETPLVSFLVAGSIYCVQGVLEYKKHSQLRFFTIGLLLALLFLTRMDSGLFITIIGVYLLIHLIKEKVKGAVKLTLIALIPFLAIIFLWLTWKIHFYGSIFPNTLSAKTEGLFVFNLLSGVEYLHLFLTTYWIGPLFIVSIFYFSKKGKALYLSFLGLCISILFAQSCYLLSIGGDFMEFRFLVPFFPLIILLTVFAFNEAFGKIAIVPILLTITFSSFYFRIKDKMAVPFSYTGIESIQILKWHLKGPFEKWSLVGQKFHEYFGDTEVRISVTAAGAIPYYSKLYTIDMLGLSDKNIKDPNRFRVLENLKSGHKRYSTLNYLLEKNVNLVIAHPKFKFFNDDSPALFAAAAHLKPPEYKTLSIDSFFAFEILPEDRSLLNHPTFLWIPLDESTKLLVLYLKKSDAVDKMISDRNWEVIRY